MNIESLLPFLLILLRSLGIAFFLEALVIYFFKIKRFWPAVGLSFGLNFLGLVVIYVASWLIGKLGYEFNGLLLPLPVIFALWWISVITDALLLRAFAPQVLPKTVLLSSIVMNTVSYLFLYFFITYSH